MEQTTVDINPRGLLKWASLKKRFDPAMALLVYIPEHEGVFLACPIGRFHGLFVFPRRSGHTYLLTKKLSGWGYAVRQAKDEGQAKDCILEYTNGI